MCGGGGCEGGNNRMNFKFNNFTAVNNNCHCKDISHLGVTFKTFADTESTSIG